MVVVCLHLTKRTSLDLDAAAAGAKAEPQGLRVIAGQNAQRIKAVSLSTLIKL